MDRILKALEDQKLSHWTQIQDDRTWKPNEPTLSHTWKYRDETCVKILSHPFIWEFRSITGHFITKIPRNAWNGSAFGDLEKVYSPRLRSALKHLLDLVHLIVLQNAPSNIKDAIFYRHNNKLILQTDANDILEQPIPDDLEKKIQKHRHVLHTNEKRTHLTEVGYVHLKIPSSMHERLKHLQSLEQKNKNTF